MLVFSTSTILWAAMLIFITSTISMGCYARIQYMYDFDGLLCSYSLHVPTILQLLCIIDVFNPMGTVNYALCGAAMLSVGYCVLHQTVCYPSAVSCDLSVGAAMLSVGYCVLHQTVCYPSHPHKPDNRTVRCTVIKMAAWSTAKLLFSQIPLLIYLNTF